MCEVIALTPRTLSRLAPAGGSAEILFFMGVRYHRMSDDEFEQATARNPARPVKTAKAKAARQAREQA